MTVYPKAFKEIVEDIKNMRIRGAGKIAVSAVKALNCVARSSKATDVEAFIKDLDSASKTLLATRPTAVSLPNGVRYVMKRVLDGEKQCLSLSDLKILAVNSTEEFVKAAAKAVETIGAIGSKRISDGDVLLTHCNSSAALSVILNAWKSGKKVKIFVTESRPRFQGLVTAEILGKAGIPVTLIVDAARHFMAKIDKVIVGADAVAANGAVINKIGTSQIALAAHEARTLFFVAAETYKFSPETFFGELVTIEERSSEEIIRNAVLNRMENVRVRNPSFDVTPPEYVDLIVTERGIIPPQGALYILHEEFGLSLTKELLEYRSTLKVEEDE